MNANLDFRMPTPEEVQASIQRAHKMRAEAAYGFARRVGQGVWSVLSGGRRGL